jgi:hypothetical protein
MIHGPKKILDYQQMVEIFIIVFLAADHITPGKSIPHYCLIAGHPLKN